MFTMRLEILSKGDLAEKTMIIDAYWKQCIKKPDQGGIDYLKGELKKYMLKRPSNDHLKIEQSIERIMPNISNEEFRELMDWITPLEAKLIDLFEGLKVIDDIERKEMKEIPVLIEKNDVMAIKSHINEMSMSVSLSIGNANEKNSSLICSDNIPSAAPFATHSVTKIFTGVLALKMIEMGIISEEKLMQPIKNLINQDAWQRLPDQLKSHLEHNNVTLYQLMLHKGGLGDYYDNASGYRNALVKKDSDSQVLQVKDFLRFAEDKIYEYEVTENPYSNIGITLVGLAIEEIYRLSNPENPLDFDGILNEYLLKLAMIDKSEFSKKMPANGRFNQNDPIAQYWVGGPAGGYWATPETLDRFGRWLFNECNTNQKFMSLVKAYGQEFYEEDRHVIEHPGTFNSSSAYFYLSLKTGNMLNILSDQQFIAPILMSTLKRNIFCHRNNESGLKYDESSKLENSKEELIDASPISASLVISTSSQALFQKQHRSESKTEVKNTDDQENKNIETTKVTGSISKTPSPKG